ncbi:flavin reductase (NADPH)-like [Diadema antillarum]|uniref:flavin reductase (NADPH)-like n=1 Tax=Diadema antillarum TaxID=105358 RepID=UPI003A8C2AA7
MKLTIFGSTGNTGLELVKLALDEGHEVVTVVRNPAKLSSIQHEKLQVVEGDIFSTEFLQTHLDGCDAVLSCLGSNSLTQATTIYSGSMKAIVPAMRAAKVSRIIIITSWYVKVDPNDDPGRMARWVIRPMLSKPLNDMAVMAKYLEDECQDIDYTMVLPPQLTNSASTGKDLVFDIGRQFTSKGDHKIPRADVAKFMLQCLKTSDFNKNCVAIAIPK